MIAELKLKMKLFFSLCSYVACNTCEDRYDGQCLNWDTFKCLGGWETGICPGANNIKCCKPCDSQCQLAENEYNDSKCEEKGGQCFDDSNNCKGRYESGNVVLLGQKLQPRSKNHTLLN